MEVSCQLHGPIALPLRMGKINIKRELYNGIRTACTIEPVPQQLPHRWVYGYTCYYASELHYVPPFNVYPLPPPVLLPNIPHHSYHMMNFEKPSHVWRE